MLVRKLPHLVAYKKNLWDKAFADIQKILGLYKATGLPALHNDQLRILFNDTNALLYDKITALGHSNLSIPDGVKEINKEHALKILGKPAGYNELITEIIAYVGNGQKSYADNIEKFIFAVKNISKHFMLDDAGNLQYTPEQLNVIEEAGNQYVTTAKGQDTYRFTQDIQKAFFANNMDRHLHNKDKISSRTLFDFLSENMDGIDLVTKEVIPIHKGAKGGGYYADAFK